MGYNAITLKGGDMKMMNFRLELAGLVTWIGRLHRCKLSHAGIYYFTLPHDPVGGDLKRNIKNAYGNSNRQVMYER